eukprot:gene18183-biopygen3917
MYGPHYVQEALQQDPHWSPSPRNAHGLLKEVEGEVQGGGGGARAGIRCTQCRRCGHWTAAARCAWAAQGQRRCTLCVRCRFPWCAVRGAGTAGPAFAPRPSRGLMKASVRVGGGDLCVGGEGGGQAPNGCAAGGCERERCPEPVPFEGRTGGCGRTGATGATGRTGPTNPIARIAQGGGVPPPSGQS